jgi:hypothetical protein
MRIAILGTALVGIATFGFLTVSVIVETGRIGPLEVLSLLVLAMFTFGIVGALRHPPDD